MRTIWKNQDKANQDLTGKDFTNAYFYRCNFTNCQFRILVNATFVECNLTNADFSNVVLKGIEVKSCTGVDTIKFREISTVNKVGKELLDKFGLSSLYPVHAHTLIAEIMKKEANNLKKASVKKAVNFMADYIASHPEYSWDSFAQIIVTKFGKQILKDGITASFSKYPHLIEKGKEMIRLYG